MSVVHIVLFKLKSSLSDAEVKEVRCTGDTDDFDIDLSC